jgi:hypothetical protein
MPHLFEDGARCTRHAELPESRLYELAVVGSRATGFHHDCASKLQTLMMAIDEIGELAGHGDPELRVATNTSNTALRELHALLTNNRALAKPPQRTAVSLAELVRVASARVGVKVVGGLRGDLDVAVPAMTHAFAILFDLLAGPIHLGRTVDARLSLTDRATLELSGPPEAGAALDANAGIASETVTIATFVIERDGGELRCKREGNAVVVTLPIKK